jgi:hypothetical protein
VAAAIRDTTIAMPGTGLPAGTVAFVSPTSKGRSGWHTTSRGPPPRCQIRQRSTPDAIGPQRRIAEARLEQVPPLGPSVILDRQQVLRLSLFEVATVLQQR